MKLQKIIRHSRPHFWMYLLGPYLIGVTAGNHHLDFASIAFLIFFGLYFLFPANLFLYGVNDVFDFETDKLNPKKQGYEDVLEPNQQKKLATIIVITSLPWIVGLFFTNIATIIAAMLFGLLSYFYSATPVRAKTKPLLDSVFNILYIAPAFIGYFLTGSTHLNWSLVLAAALWTIAMHAYSAVPDIAADKKAYLNTIATFLGSKGTLTLCTLCYLASSLLAGQSLGTPVYILGLVYLLMMRISFQQKTEADLLKIYKWFPVINILSGFALFVTVAVLTFQK